MAHECPECGLLCHCHGDIDDVCYGEAINCNHCDFSQGEESICYDCMRDKDNCPDCCNGDLYRSPDAYRED